MLRKFFCALIIFLIYSATLIFCVFVVLGFLSCLGCAGPGGPSVIINRYDYQAHPVTISPGVSSVDSNAPLPVNYQTVYDSSFDDPTMVVFNNKSYQKVKIIIDSQKPIALTAYQATADLHLGVGEHRVKIVVEKPTQAHGTLEVNRELRVEIRPESRSQIFYIYDY